MSGTSEKHSNDFVGFQDGILKISQLSANAELASKTAWAKPFGVTDRKDVRCSEGGSRCILLPSQGVTRLALGITKPLPVQRQVFLV